MAPNKKWKQFLTSDPLGKIFWDNLEYDLQHENLSFEVYEQFLSTIDQFMEASREETLAIDAIVKALGEPPVLFSLQGLRKPDTEPLSRVVDAQSFATHHVRYDEKFGYATEETLTQQIWTMFKNGDIVPKRHFKGDLRSGRNLFWGTPTRCLEGLCETRQIRPNEFTVEPPEKADNVATEIRNLLGLSHMNEGVGLYRIDIPIELLTEVKICAPTTLDSSPRCVFLPAEGTSRYGWTLDLREMKPGAEEVVIEPITFTKDFKVTQIGFVRGPLPNEQDVWDALAKIVQKRLPTVKKRVVKRRTSREGH